jgi:integrase
MALDPDGKSDTAWAKSVAPTAGTKIHYDSEVPGFGLRVTPNGSKAFVLNYRTRSGHERRYTIGQFPGLSVAAARKRAAELKQEIRDGKDPLQQLEEERAAPTVADLCRRFEEEHLTKKRASTAKDYKAAIERAILPAWRNRKVADIEYADADALHRRITNQGARTKGRGSPYQANRTMAIGSKMWTLAIRLKWCTKNPFQGIERNPELRRERYLTPPELSALLVALAERDEVARTKRRHSDRPADIARLLLLTGARSGELLSATWGQLNLRDGIWTKPASNTKQKLNHRIPLSAPARQLLAEMRSRLATPPADSDMLFPTRRTDAPKTDIKNSWAKITARATVIFFASRPDEPDGKLVADLSRSLGREPTIREVAEAAQAVGIELPVGLRDLRQHDLRHSHASFLASDGLSLPVIGALLGHSNPATTARYAHLLDDPLRKATERVGERIAGGGAVAEVLPLKGTVR